MKKNSKDPCEAPVTRRTVVVAGLALMTTGCVRQRGAAVQQIPSSAPTAISPLKPTAPAHPISPPTMNSPQVRVVARSHWTNAPVGANSDPMGMIKKITLHHTGEHLSSSGIADTELIQRIERHHRVNLGWAAIGYHFLIGKDGTIYEGRPAHFQGAHCGGDNNRNNLGITMIGEFDHRLPGPAQLAALTAFLADQRTRYRIPAREVFGHRDIKNTVCPGDRLYTWLNHYRLTAS